MKKMIPFFFVFICLIGIKTYAQEKEKSNTQIKAYYNFNRIDFGGNLNLSDNQYMWIQPNVVNNTLGEFSVALLLEKNQKVSHEFELMPLSIYKSETFETLNPDEEYYWEVNKEGLTTFNSRFRYQYISTVFDREKFDFYVGLSSMLSFFQQQNKTSNSWQFPKTYTQFSLVFGLTPGFIIPISEKLDFSLDVPVGIAGLNTKRIKYENPEIKVNERIQSTLNAELWHLGFQVRAGIGFKL